MDPSTLFRNQPNSQSSSRRSLRTPLVVFAVCLILGGAVVAWRANARAESAQQHTRAEAAMAAAAVEQQLARALSAVDAVAALVRQGNGQAPGFQQFALDLLPAHPGIKSLEVQPAGVVADVAPRAGYERTIGTDVFRNPAHRSAAAAAYHLRRTIINGPVTLAPGEPGLLGRRPVFIRDRTGKEVWWGFAAVSIRLNEVVRNARLPDLAARGFEYALISPANSLQAAGTIASSSPSATVKWDLVQPIRIANLDLRLAVRPKSAGSDAGGLVLPIGLAVMFSALMAGLVYLWERRGEASLATAAVASRAAREADRFRVLLEATSEALVITDRSGRIQSVNASAEKLFGWRRTELTGQAVEVLIPERVRKNHPAHREHFLRTPQARPMGTGLQLAGLRKDGAEFPIEVDLTPMDGPEGRGSVVCCAVRDLTAARKRNAELSAQQDQLRAGQDAMEAVLTKLSEAGANLERQEARFRLIAQTSREGLLWTDASGVVIEANEAVSRMLGCPREQLIGRRLADLAGEEGWQAVEQSFLRQPDDDAGPREMTLGRPDGSQVPCALSASPQRSEQGALLGFLVLVTDLTSVQKLEQELRSAQQTAEEHRLRLEAMLGARLSPAESPVVTPEAEVQAEPPAMEESAPMAQALPTDQAERPLTPSLSPDGGEGVREAEQEDVDGLNAQGSSSDDTSAAPPVETAKGAVTIELTTPSLASEPELGAQPITEAESGESQLVATDLPETAQVAVVEQPLSEVSTPVQEAEPATEQPIELRNQAVEPQPDQTAPNLEPVPVEVTPIEAPSVVQEVVPPPAVETAALVAEPVRETKPPKSSKRKKTKRDDQMSLFGEEPSAAAAPSPEPPKPEPVIQELVSEEPAIKVTEVPPLPVEPTANASPVAVASPENPATEAPQPTEPASASESTAEPVPSEPRRLRKGIAPTGEEPAETTSKVPDLGLPPIKGLDTTEGLQRAAGSRKVYFKRLRQFVENQPRTVEQVRDLLVQGDSANAIRITNALKESASELGAAGVQTAAADLDRAIREQLDPAEVELLWAILEEAVTGLVGDLKPALKSKEPKPAPKPAKPPPPFDAAEFRRAFNEILPLLTDIDPGAKDCLKANHEPFRSAFSPEAFADFEHAVKAGEYAEALELLKKAARKHSIG